MKKLFFYLMGLTVFCQYSCGSNTGAVNQGDTEDEDRLANGMIIETYKIKKTVDFPPQKSSCTKSEFDYSVDWPIDGPQPLLKKTQKWILRQLNPDESSSDQDLSEISMEKLLEERITNYSPEYDEDADWYYGVVTDDIGISIEADDNKTILLSSFETVLCGQNSLGFSGDRLMMLNNGEELSYSMFPPIEKMRPYLWKYMKCFGEPCQVWEYPELEKVPYPKNLPVITENGIEFIWGLDEIYPRVQFTSEVPYSDILRLINKDVLVFIPQKAIEDFKKNSNGDLKKETMLLYVGEGLKNDENDYISHEFADILDLTYKIPTDNPGGINSYDILYWDWTGDDSSDCLDFGFKDAEIVSRNENSAKGRLKFKPCIGGIKYIDVDLVKEKFVYPSGLEETRWVVDDFDNKKAELLAAINEAGTAFSHGLGQRLMSNPEDSGFMSEKEKREYLQQVDTFLNAYNKFKSKKQ